MRVRTFLRLLSHSVLNPHPTRSSYALNQNPAISLAKQVFILVSSPSGVQPCHFNECGFLPMRQRMH